MGLDCSYDFWIEQDKVFDFMTALSRRCWEPLVLMWPDGRRVDFSDPVDDFDTVPTQSPREVPLNIGLEGEPIGENSQLPFYFPDLCLSLPFDRDPDLWEYEEQSRKEWERERQDSIAAQPPQPFLKRLARWLTRGSQVRPQKRRKVEIGCIYLDVQWAPNQISWLDHEPSLAHIRFKAATTGISMLFLHSPSVRRFFVDLAHAGGATSLVCDGDFSTELLFLDGEKMDVFNNTEAEDAWHLNDIQLHPRELRAQIGRASPHPSVAPMRQLLAWSWRSDKPSRAEWDEVLALTRAPDSGLRAQALANANLFKEELQSEHSVDVQNITLSLRQDEDWRVRFVADSILQEDRYFQLQHENEEAEWERRMAEEEDAPSS